ncbi:hypothetical protein NLI96_g8938 [Meripilus lineatus]|uniref:Helicase ATP-binding domain-containing protein n=1 Tax=Meripilus lineatus TaxID=2056292 RepID=A0AAD5YFR6_9APHY|nr:hypothetical protein NLI96_g8938 [Physisporinus lineatus]
MPCRLIRTFLRSYSSKHAPSVVLRPYQESCLEACTDALTSGASRIGVSLPTGSGKTTVFITLLSRILPAVARPEAHRSLVIVNSIELARQAAAQALRLYPSWSVEIEQGAKHQATGKADLTVATYQTLLQANRLAKFDPNFLKAVIVDEAHHAAAPSYRRILSHFHSAIKNPDPTFTSPTPLSIPILGFSATFSRHDGLALGSVFERIVYHRDFLEMIKEQWLCNVRFTSVRANIDLSEVTVNSSTGDFNPTSLAHVINTVTVNNLVVKSWLDRASTRRSTLVFCVNLAHVRDLTNTFRAAGIDARYIYSGTPASERAALVSGFRQGQFPVLVNCGMSNPCPVVSRDLTVRQAILTEGADIPNIDCVIVARPTRSRNVFAQMVSQYCALHPFVNSTSKVAGVISVPSLFGLDPSEMIDDNSTEELEERSKEKENADTMQSSPDYASDVPDPKSVTYVDHDDPFSLVDQSSGAPHIRTLSRHAWVGCGGDVYVLECMGKGFIRIESATSEEEGDHFRAVYTPTTMPFKTAFTLGVSPYRQNRNVLTARTLDEAVRGCDNFAKNKVVPGPMALGLLRSARWRNEPATPNQKALIRKKWSKKYTNIVDIQINGKKEEEKLQKIATMLKGEAANIITRLKHGAQARYEKKNKQTMKVARLVAKENKRKAREHVEVGPLSA